MKTYNLRSCPDNIKNMIKSNNDVFGTLSNSIFIEIFDSKEQIVSFNKPVTKFRFLLQGKAKISLIHENGNQSIVHFVYPKEFIGELTFLEIEKEHKNVIAISQCIFISIDMFEAKKTLKNDSKFLYNLSQFIGNKLLLRTNFNSKNQNYELRNRLAAYILATQYNGIYTEKHTETASYLSISYRHLLYTFKNFIEEGILIKEKKGFKINKSKLVALAKDIKIL